MSGKILGIHISLSHSWVSKLKSAPKVRSDIITQALQAALACVSIANNAIITEHAAPSVMDTTSKETTCRIR